MYTRQAGIKAKLNIKIQIQGATRLSNFKTPALPLEASYQQRSSARSESACGAKAEHKTYKKIHWKEEQGRISQVENV